MASNSGGSKKKSNQKKDDSWCGPFTVARQMIAAREDAKRKRQEEAEEADGMQHPLDEMMEQVEEEKRIKAHPSLLWKSRIASPSTATTSPDDKSKSKKQRTSQRVRLPPSAQELNPRKIPSLYQLCIDFVVTNFDHVESLGSGVDHTIRTSIAHELASQNRLNGIALAALMEDDLESLELVDCADIPQEALCDGIKRAGNHMRHLMLDQAGRCFGKSTIESLLNPTHTSAANPKPVPLFTLHVGGAYLLKDDDGAKVIETLSPTLQSIAFKACPLLGLQFCKSIPQSYQQENTLLELSLEDMTFSPETWQAMMASFTTPTDSKAKSTTATTTPSLGGWQRNLKSLALKRMINLQDDFVVALLRGAPNLEHVDLSDNYDLTDVCLSALRCSHEQEHSHLRSLSLSNLKQLTNVGLETLFTPELEGMGPPPQLKMLSLNHLDVDAVTDEVMELVLQCASMKPTVAAAAAAAGAGSPGCSVGGLSLLGGMIRLELQGAAITDTTLEGIAATSANTLEHLNVSFCPQISDKGLGYLVDTVHHQLEGVQIWGCAQITEQFWNGHSRAMMAPGLVPEEEEAESPAPQTILPVVPLQVVGAWMKKSGIASIR